MLSAIVQKVTGQTVLDYLRPRLFDPLGIVNPTWEASRQGVSMGGFGLSIRTEDIARFGQLYLQKGQWQGKQLLPAAWVETATARHASNGSSPSSDWEQGYGYQFWRSRHGFYRGDGAHGQYCLVLPQYDAVIAITSGTRDMASVMNLVWDQLVPALKPAALPADRPAHERLTARLATLTLRTPGATTAVAPASTYVGRRYAFAANPQSIESIVLDSADASTTSFTIRIAGVDERVVASPGVWRKGTITVRGTPDPIAASGTWTADGAYTLAIVRYRTPFATTYRLRFSDDGAGRGQRTERRPCRHADGAYRRPGIAGDLGPAGVTALRAYPAIARESDRAASGCGDTGCRRRPPAWPGSSRRGCSSRSRRRRSPARITKVSPSSLTQIDAAAARERRARERESAAADARLVDLGAGLRVGDLQHAVVVHRVDAPAIDERRGRVAREARLHPRDERAGLSRRRCSVMSPDAPGRMASSGRFASPCDPDPT